MKIEFKSVNIHNEDKLVEYIEGTSRMSAKHSKEITSLEEVKTKILEAATNLSYLLDFGIEVECMKGWDKVHLFEYKSHFNSELSVSYKGTLKY